MRFKRTEVIKALTKLKQISSKDPASMGRMVYCSPMQDGIGGSKMMFALCNPEKEVMIAQTVPCLGIKPFSYRIDPVSFSAFLRRCMAYPWIGLGAKDKDHFFVDMGGQVFSVPAISDPEEAEPFPAWTAPAEDEEIERVAWNCGELLEVMEFSSKAMCPDEFRPHMHGLLVCPETVVGIDGHRIHKVDVALRSLKRKVLLPAPLVLATIRQLKAFAQPEDTIWMTVSDTHVRFTGLNGWWEVIGRPAKERFPPYDRVLPAYLDGHQLVRIDSKRLREATGAILALGEGVGVHLKINGEFSVCGEQGGSIGVPTCKGSRLADIELGVNGSYLIDALAGVDKTVNLRLCKGSPIIIETIRNHLASIMPMRI